MNPIIKLQRFFSDSKSAIATKKNSMFHKKARHIKIKYHFLQYVEEEQDIGLMYCKTEEQLADIFAKGTI